MVCNEQWRQATICSAVKSLKRTFNMLAMPVQKEYDGKEIVHAIKLCRYIAADLQCADLIYRFVLERHTILHRVSIRK